MKILVLNEGFFGNLKNKAKQFSSKVKDKFVIAKRLWSLYISKLSINLEKYLKEEKLDNDKIKQIITKFNLYFDSNQVKNKYLAVINKDISKKDEVFIIDDLIVAIILGKLTIS